MPCCALPLKETDDEQSRRLAPEALAYHLRGDRGMGTRCIRFHHPAVPDPASRQGVQCRLAAYGAGSDSHGVREDCRDYRLGICRRPLWPQTFLHGGRIVVLLRVRTEWPRVEL